MAETYPRWNLTDVLFVDIDPAKIEAEAIARCEAALGRSLAPADPVRLFVLSETAREIQLRNCINIAAQQNLLTYAQGKNLDALGDNLSVQRLQDSPAVTTLEFTLSEVLANVYVIPVGFQVTNGTLTFATDAELIIPAGEMTGEMTATCTTNGTAGNNYLPGQISTIVRPMAFLASAENSTITSGGADVERDEAFAERLRLAPNSWSCAGSEKAYVFHALSVSPAIVDVSVTSPNPGEVKVYPLMQNGELPTEEILNQVETYLSAETIRPLTDDVEVLSPVPVEYEIVLDYWINKSNLIKTETIRTAVEKAVEEYRVWQQAKIGRDITPDQLICKVMAAGADRVNFATLSPNVWEHLDTNEVAQCTNVTITYQGAKED